MEQNSFPTQSTSCGVWLASLPTHMCGIPIPGHALGTDAVKASVQTTVAKLMGWSLRIAATGIAPTQGYYNEELAGHRKELAGKLLAAGWKATYFCFRADEKARKECNFWPRSYLHNYICVYCMAMRQHKDWIEELSYKNMHEEAVHRMTNISCMAVPLSL